MNSHPESLRHAIDPVKEATIGALAKVMEPIIELMLDAGVTVQELNQIARAEAVRIASKRVAKSLGRESKSRVAILTGLPRSEVGKISKVPRSGKQSRSRHHAGRRVLAGWHENSKYLAPDGAPAILPIFGKRGSFERLVAEYGGGIPVRAMLDELTELNAVDHLDNQRVSAKTRVPILTGLNSRTISALGERGNDLLRTLGHNLRAASKPMFESTASIELGDMDMATFVRREIAEQGANFINAANSLLNRARVKPPSKRVKSGMACRLGVTVFYFQDELSSAQGLVNERTTKRKNLRRRPA